VARIRSTVSLKHRPNVASDVVEVELAEGEEVTILNEWRDHYFIKNGDGLLFNIPKELVEA
jgi:hypothetical protein